MLKELANAPLQFDFAAEDRKSGRVPAFRGRCHEASCQRARMRRPVRCLTQTATRVVSDHRPSPSQDGGCLRWLDVDRMKGGAGARLDRGEVKARPSGSRKSGPRGETPQVERRKAR